MTEAQARDLHSACLCSLPRPMTVILDAVSGCDDYWKVEVESLGFEGSELVALHGLAHTHDCVLHIWAEPGVTPKVVAGFRPKVVKP